jgi:hypothetical protein
MLTWFSSLCFLEPQELKRKEEAAARGRLLLMSGFEQNIFENRNNVMV